MTAQPEWKLVWATDQRALYVDETGVYPPELEVLEEINDAEPEERFEVYRAIVDRFKVHGVLDGSVLVPFEYEPDWPWPAPHYQPWFRDSLEDVARSIGDEPAALVGLLCSEEPNARAAAVDAIAGYHGWLNFDQYPQRISERRADGWPDWRKVEDKPDDEEPDDECEHGRFVGMCYECEEEA